ncbi:e53fe445-2a3b-439e-ab96-2687b9f0a5ed-CDS [Sclerotinia trifoliorum]|uniref:E53fe445-2a3b-439e-ab96-2687b9f0a5ed-CDS n=1 Tax=Sclerotinia trifoliorum TaxID=28548 RepID=A0A8H2VW36_9HELO|nr:e53fe445-2a3b-439e-ab96-2687b9f0a5ed-CDS [Sclerotinia trifoliorum]
MAVSRTPISHSQRVGLRRYYQTTNPKPTQSDLRAWFKSRFGYDISQSIVSKSLSDSFAYLDVCVASDSEYRTRNCQWPWIETLLTNWLREAEALSGKISNKIIGRKAKQLWDQSDESQGLATPKFSTGWVMKFRRRHEMTLQPLPEQEVTPDHSSGENSFAPSHRSSAETPKQALVSFSPQSEALITISSTNNPSLDSEINASAMPTISSDHLIHLVQHNSYRALMSNKSLLLTTSLIFEASNLTATIKQFATTVCGGLTVIYPLVGQIIPDTLYPTQLQMNCAHTGLINMFPFPKFRDNLIEKGVDFVPEEMCRDLFGDIFPDYITPIPDADECTLNMHEVLSVPSSVENGGSGIEDFEDQDDYTAGRKCLITWGDPWRVESWEVTPGFIRKWGWSLEGCDDLIQSSNRWRALRNERPITWISRI